MEHAPSEHFCCVECFDDPVLRRLITEQGAIRDCQYCDSKNVSCVELADLRPHFNKVIELFQPEDEPTMSGSGEDDDDYEQQGMPLADWLQEIWGIFSDKHVNGESAGMLLDDLRVEYDDTGGQPVFFTYDGVSSDSIWTIDYGLEYDVSVGYLWGEFLRQLRHQSESVPEKSPELEKLLASMAQRLEGIIPIDIEMYRGRRSESNHSPDKLTAKDLDAPPPDKARAGRASPEGTPVLYTAEDVATTIAEVRPLRGAFVTLGRFLAKEPLRIVDLADPKYFDSPFTSTSLREDVVLKYMAEVLGTAFSEPVSDSDSKFDYLPTQYVSAFLQSCGYDGIRYPSAMNSTGRNLVVFDSARTENQNEIRIYKVKGLTYEYHEPFPYILKKYAPPPAKE